MSRGFVGGLVGQQFRFEERVHRRRGNRLGFSLPHADEAADVGGSVVAARRQLNSLGHRSHSGPVVVFPLGSQQDADPLHHQDADRHREQGAHAAQDDGEAAVRP